jgi:hypothetical protein
VRAHTPPHLQVDLQVGDQVGHVLTQLQQRHHAAGAAAVRSGPVRCPARPRASGSRPAAAAAAAPACDVPHVLPGLLQVQLHALQPQQQLE